MKMNNGAMKPHSCQPCWGIVLPLSETTNLAHQRGTVARFKPLAHHMEQTLAASPKQMVCI